jgi:hypothetical protein
VFIVFAVLCLSASYRNSQLKSELKNKEEEFYRLKFDSHRDMLMQKAEYEGIITRKDENKKLVAAYRNAFDNICKNFILQDNHSMTRYLAYGDESRFELDMLQKKEKEILEALEKDNATISRLEKEVREIPVLEKLLREQSGNVMF